MSEITTTIAIPEPVFDDGPHPRAQIGYVLVPNADLSEADFFAMKPAGVGVHFTRVAMPAEISVDGLKETTEQLAVAAASMMSGRDDLDVISYSCTSGTFVVGEQRIIDELIRLNPRPKATTMLSACVAALRSMKIDRLVLGTAYTEDLNRREADFLRDSGFDVLRVEGLGLLTDQEMNRVTPDYLADFACAIDHPQADAIFMSCGALRVLPVIEDIEARTGKPVVFSNQANFWHCLRLAGVDDHIEGFGRLLREY